jgi:Phage integrase family
VPLAASYAVFPTRTGEKLGATNVRKRVLAPAVDKANMSLADEDVEPLPEGLTPHSLRRTYASVLVALKEDPARVMRQMGHTSPEMMLGVYAQAMDWGEGAADRLRDLVNGADLAAPIGTKAVEATGERSRLTAGSRTTQGLATNAPGRIRTCDLSLRRRALYPLSYGRLAEGA